MTGHGGWIGRGRRWSAQSRRLGLVDVSVVGDEVGFRIPVAMTAAAWQRAVARAGGSGQGERGRLWDVLWLASLGVRQAEGVTVRFEVWCLSTDPGEGRGRVELEAHIGLGSDGQPLLTIGLPWEWAEEQAG